MEVIPAVDIMKGEVVRLVQGDPRSMKSYKSLGDPLSLAKKWQTEGAETIHIIDLDAALGLGNNGGVIKEIVETVKASTQVGGGIQSLEVAKTLLDIGVDRIILGSLAFRNQYNVKTLLNEYGKNRIMVALDHFNGIVVVNGWTAPTKLTVDEAMPIFCRLGATLFLVTSVSRDGTMRGPDFEILKRSCLRDVGVIAAGGVRSVEDIVALKSLGVLGVVVGRALYESRLSLKEAISAAKG
jgi:phosphoribosylformimino-5-aminoimidazole carboxamide ribotide isomerase